MSLFGAFQARQKKRTVSKSFSLATELSQRFDFTYWWELLVGKIRITYVVYLRIEDWNNLFWTHDVYLESEVCYLVKVLISGRSLDER